MMDEHDLMTPTSELNTSLKELRPAFVVDSLPRELQYKSYLNTDEFRVEIPFLYRAPTLLITLITVVWTFAVICLYALVTTTPRNTEELAGYVGIVGIAIAFTTIWFALFFYTLKLLFGKERLRITPNGVYYETIVFFVQSTVKLD